MPKSLLIVESPAKIRTLREIVGRRFEIKASIGHIRDIPENELGVDVERNFAMTFVTIKGKGKAINEIKAAARAADAVYLATDPDREGEAIAWHVRQIIPSTPHVYRITFNAITRSEVERALQHPGQIDQRLVEAQFARRIIDRLIGYLLSPEATRHLGENFSVGRVQSPALGLIVEREREIRAFKPEPYWLLRVTYRKGDVTFPAVLKAGRVASEAEADRLVRAIKAAPTHTVTAVRATEVTKNPPPPFITSTFQRAAFKALRMNSKRAMRVAQDLYEGVDVAGKHVALITYMRTDSPRIAPEGLEAAKEQVTLQFGAAYYQRRVFRGRAGAQDAHEAIRPAHPEITPEMAKPYLDKPHHQVYELIYRRWLASQMKPAIVRRTTVTIQAGDVELEAVGQVLLFEGFLRAYGRELDEQDRDEDEGSRLPPLEEGEHLALVDAAHEQKTTQPPPRYNNGTLIEKLEKLGIGRPSTYAAIVELILQREYVIETAKKRELVPTPKGEKLYDYLKQYRPIVVDYDFTAHIESELDAVEEGEKSYLHVVREEFERVKDAYELYKKSGGFAMAHKPTAKQLQLAHRLAAAAHLSIPDEALRDSKLLSDWIDHVKAKVDLPSLPPSPKQLKYAESLAAETGMQLTEELRADATKISQFIDQARKIRDRQLAANSRQLTIHYLADDHSETEYDTIRVLDIIDVPDKKAIGLRLSPWQTKWIPRSQIVRLTDCVLTLKNRWAAENVYGRKASLTPKTQQRAKQPTKEATPTKAKAPGSASTRKTRVSQRTVPTRVPARAR
ncbi:MAG: type I DNA topoisomerase [bacterium]|nr:type I DNA topoisomerase [bacterium]